jgi:hypothetical protein
MFGERAQIESRTLTSRCRHFVRTVGTMVDVVAHQIVGDAMRQCLTFELSAVMDWNKRKRKKNKKNTFFKRGVFENCECIRVFSNLFVLENCVFASVPHADVSHYRTIALLQHSTRANIFFSTTHHGLLGFFFFLLLLYLFLVYSIGFRTEVNRVRQTSVFRD